MGRSIINNIFIILIYINFLGQIGGLRLGLARFESPRAKRAIKTSFFVLNAAWIVMAALMWRHDMFGRGLWSWLEWPWLSQLASFSLLFPGLAILLFFGLAKLAVWAAGFWQKPALRGAGSKGVDSADADEKRKIGADKGDNPKLTFELAKNEVLLKILEGSSNSGHGSNEKNEAETLESPRLMEALEKAEPPKAPELSKVLEPLETPEPPKNRKKGFSRREFLRKAAAGGLLTTAALAGYGVARQAVHPNVVRKTLAFPNLPSELEGFKICQISDLHLGVWQTKWDMARAFESAAAERPALVVLTGDLVDESPANAKLYYEPLDLFGQVPHGVYAILGNHDHYTGAAEVASLLGRRLNMLVQNRVLLPGAPMTIVGLDDPGHRAAFVAPRWKRGADDDPDVLTFSNVQGPPFRAGDFNLLLNHRPEGYRQASREGFDLYLAGHTHGGQYQVPFAKGLNAAAIFYKYSSGLYHEHPTWLNVSRGVGTVGLPFRVFAWPEIDVITLAKV